LGVSFDVPAGYEEETPVPAPGSTTRVLRLFWAEGPYAGLEFLITARSVTYETPVIAAGLYQRRRGIDKAFEARAGLLTEEDLARIGAQDGVRIDYITKGEGPRRVTTFFLTVNGTLYRVEVFRPIAPEGDTSEPISLFERSLRIYPGQDNNTPEGGAEAPLENE
jgi:hypothetical protein